MLFTMHGANVILQSRLLWRRLKFDRQPERYQTLEVKKDVLLVDDVKADVAKPTEE